MRVGDIDVTTNARGARLTGRVISEDPRLVPQTLEFVYSDTPAAAVTSPGDALAAAVFGPAVMAGEDVHVDAPVSPALIRNMRRINRVWKDWVPSARIVEVEAPAEDRSRLAPEGVSASFTGGVDSFFTALRPRTPPIDTLITVLGVIGPRLPALDPLIPALEAAASAMGKRHLTVSTNSYVYGTAVVRDSFHLGAVLVAPALGLGGSFRRHYVASGPPLHRLLPAGTHPATDPYWSTESLEVVHDGLEFNRVEKTIAIAHSQVALDHLNVCQVGRASAENCRFCNKCQLTALALLAEGTLGRCRSLGPVTPSTLRRAQIGLYVQNFLDLKDRVDDPELKHAIDAAVRRAHVRSRLRPVAGLALRPFRRMRWRRWRRSLGI